MTDAYAFGDWVVFDPGYCAPEVGRVTEDTGRTAYVCYHQGCTAAGTDKRHLRRATMEEILSAPRGIGFHRFDEACPERDEELCGHCRAWKGRA